MAERLEARLRELEPSWPPTPDLAAAVAAQLAARPAPAPARRRRRRAVLALAAALLLVPAAAVAFPGARDDVLEALGLRHVTVERRPVLPQGRDPRLGTRTTLAGAAARAGFAPRVPATLGAPDHVYVLDRIVTLVYDDERLLVAQARGGLDAAVLHKLVHAGDEVRAVRVGGARGVYLRAGHRYFWADATGPPVRSGPALVWERDGLVLRLEGAAPAAAAVRIATSVR